MKENFNPALEHDLRSLLAQHEKAEIRNLDNDTIGRLLSLTALLMKWNQSLNLTAIRKESEILRLHIMDSASISPYLIGDSIADVGTGAGFPGLVLAALNPERNFTLIDSVSKKLSFVRMAMVELGLKNVILINDRCEKIQNLQFDCIVSRAFAPLERMVSWCLHLLKEDGTFIAMKAKLDKSELNEIPTAVKLLKVETLCVPGVDAQRRAVFLTRV